MEYTVLQLAKLAGVSTRTLRYYEEVKLLIPAGRKENKYRYYSQIEVDKLQQILFYKELGMELIDIQNILNSPDFNKQFALEEHLKQLLLKKTRIEQLIKNVQNTMKHEKGLYVMSNQEKFEGLKKEMVSKNEEKYGKEIREKYGADRIEKSNAKMMNLTQEEYEKMTNLGVSLNELLEEAVNKEAAPASELGKAAYEMHKEWLSFTWQMYSKEAHIGLSQMYLADKRFKEYYDSKVEGCALFLKEAIAIHAQ